MVMIMNVKKVLLATAFVAITAFACDVKAQIMLPTPTVNPTADGRQTSVKGDNGNVPVGSATLLLLSMLGCATGAKLYMNNKKKGE